MLYSPWRRNLLLAAINPAASLPHTHDLPRMSFEYEIIKHTVAVGLCGWARMDEWLHAVTD